MGSLFYTFEEAAARLSCSKRTIHNHVKHGYLRKTNQAGKVVLHKEDVEQYAIDKGTDLPALNRKNVAFLEARIQRLERDMAVCKLVLDIRDNPVRPSKEDATALLREASKAIAANYWTEAELDMWATVFNGFDEVSLNLLQEHLALPRPYETFFKLCVAQMQNISIRPEFQTTLSLQLLHKKLDEGRKKMRETLLMWTSVTGGVVPEMVLETLESEKGALFKKLSNPKGN